MRISNFFILLFISIYSILKELQFFQFILLVENFMPGLFLYQLIQFHRLKNLYLKLIIMVRRDCDSYYLIFSVLFSSNKGLKIYKICLTIIIINNSKQVN